MDTQYEQCTEMFCVSTALINVEVVQLVVISGLVWNWPTSCAWAARVYVNDRYGHFWPEHKSSCLSAAAFSEGQLLLDLHNANIYF